MTETLKNYKEEHMGEAIGYLIAIVLVAFIQKCTLILFDWNEIQWKIRTKVAIQYCLYQKALKTKQFTSQKSVKIKLKIPNFIIMVFSKYSFLSNLVNFFRIRMMDRILRI